MRPEVLFISGCPRTARQAQQRKKNYEYKRSFKNYRRQPEQAFKNAWLVNRPASQRMQNRLEAPEGSRVDLL
jgi:hypothetical protein